MLSNVQRQPAPLLPVPGQQKIPNISMVRKKMLVMGSFWSRRGGRESFRASWMAIREVSCTARCLSSRACCSLKHLLPFTSSFLGCPVPVQTALGFCQLQEELLFVCPELQAGGYRNFPLGPRRVPALHLAGCSDALGYLLWAFGGCEWFCTQALGCKMWPRLFCAWTSLFPCSEPRVPVCNRIWPLCKGLCHPSANRLLTEGTL